MVFHHTLKPPHNFLIALVILFFIFLFSMFGPTITSFQTFTCSTEEVSSGSGGEIRITSQSRGVENSGNCLPAPCSAGTFDVGIFTDKSIHLTQSYPIYRYERICIKSATAGEIKQCQAGIKSANDTATPCTPDACSQGTSIATLLEIRDYDYLTTQDWIGKLIRICAGGGWITSGSSQAVEQQSPQSFPDPPQCISGEESVGVIKETHHFEPDYFRTYRLCVKYSPPTPLTAPTTTSSTTTTLAPTTSSSSATTTTASLTNETNVSTTTTALSTNETNVSTTTTISPSTNETNVSTTVSTATATTTATIPSTATTSAPPIEQEVRTLIGSAESQISTASEETKNSTALIEAKNLLIQAKLLEAEKKYEEAKLKALEAISLAETARAKAEGESILSLVIVAILAIMLIAILIYFQQKES